MLSLSALTSRFSTSTASLACRPCRSMSCSPPPFPAIAPHGTIGDSRNLVTCLYVAKACEHAIPFVSACVSDAFAHSHFYRRTRFGMPTCTCECLHITRKHAHRKCIKALTVGVALTVNGFRGSRMRSLHLLSVCPSLSPQLFGQGLVACQEGLCRLLRPNIRRKHAYQQGSNNHCVQAATKRILEAMLSAITIQRLMQNIVRCDI